MGSEMCIRDRNKTSIKNAATEDFGLSILQCVRVSNGLRIDTFLMGHAVNDAANLH